MVRAAIVVALGVVVGASFDFAALRSGRAEPGERGGRYERVVQEPSPMVHVPSGAFAMGFPNTEEERNDFLFACERQLALPDDKKPEFCQAARLWLNALEPREVFVRAFYLDRYEVDVRSYRACAAAGGCDVTPLVTADPGYLQDDLPMVFVTWQDAADYCAWRGKRLPTEAEWEKAARGTDGRRWPWGNHERIDGSNHGAVEPNPQPWDPVPFVFIGDDTDGAATVVPPGAMAWADSPYGAYDLAGNVSEWVADYYRADYIGMPLVNPVQETAVGAMPLRVVRGGSWATPRYYGRTYFRNFAQPEDRSFERGFRCARYAAE